MPSTFTKRQVAAFVLAVGSYWPVRLALFMMITLPDRLLALNDRTTKGCQEGEGIGTFYAVLGGIAGVGLLAFCLGGIILASTLLADASPSGRVTFVFWTLALQGVVISISGSWSTMSIVALLGWILLSLVFVVIRHGVEQRGVIKPRVLVTGFSAVSVLVLCSSCAIFTPSYCIN